MEIESQYKNGIFQEIKLCVTLYYSLILYSEGVNQA